MFSLIEQNGLKAGLPDHIALPKKTRIQELTSTYYRRYIRSCTGFVEIIWNKRVFNSPAKVYLRLTHSSPEVEEDVTVQKEREDWLGNRIILLVLTTPSPTQTQIKTPNPKSKYACSQKSAQICARAIRAYLCAQAITRPSMCPIYNVPKQAYFQF